MAKRRTLEERARDAKEKSDALARRVAERELRKTNGTMKRLRTAHSAMCALRDNEGLCDGLSEEIRSHSEYSARLLSLEIERLVDEGTAR